MLNKAGLKAEPLLISTKEHGSIFVNLTRISQFNRMIVYLTIRSRKYFLDASNQFAQFGFLTPSTKVDVGLHIKKKNGFLINIVPLISKNRTKIITNALLDTTGSIHIESNIIFRGYRALNEREEIHENKDLESLIQDRISNSNQTAELDTFYYSNFDSIDKPLHLTIKYKLPDYSTIIGNLIYFTPPFITKWDSNSLEKEERDFPVDFSYKHDTRETINIEFPASYKITDKPETKKALMKKLSFSKLFFSTGNKLECVRNFSRKRTHFGTSEYKKLRDIFNSIYESDQDIIVLEKMAK